MVKNVNWDQTLVGVGQKLSPILRSLMIAVVLVQITTLPVRAGQFSVAVKTYESGSYRSAATKFEKITQEQPRNEKAHYYLGLAYKGMGKYAAAEHEFVWVTKNGSDKTCIDYSTQQILAIKQINKSVIQKVNATLSARDLASKPAATAPAKKNLGRCRVIFLGIGSNGECDEFAPQFEEAKRKYQNKIDFQQMDAESDGASLAQQYAVTWYPRLVYLDGKGKLLYNEGRGEFQNRLKELTAP